MQYMRSSTVQMTFKQQFKQQFVLCFSRCQMSGRLFDLVVQVGLVDQGIQFHLDQVRPRPRIRNTTLKNCRCFGQLRGPCPMWLRWKVKVERKLSTAVWALFCLHFVLLKGLYQTQHCATWTTRRRAAMKGTVADNYLPDKNEWADIALK